MEYFHTFQVVKVDFQHNELKHIPRCLLQLPSLAELNLSRNQLESVPDIVKWSPFLTVLDLSHNKLRSLPPNVDAPSIYNLNISHNQLHQVPMCICSFNTLHALDLSNNVDILTLPAEMGRLSRLSKLNLHNLKDLHDPPRTVQGHARDCIRYLNSKLRSAKGFYRMKLMLVGCANRGKTTLAARLQGRNCDGDPTVGVDVSEWRYRPGLLLGKSFYFSIWDFGGQEEYYATHQCFLSQRSLYLLLFNLKHGRKGVQELKPWLNNIALRAPKSCIIIVGTHLDEVKQEERGDVHRLLEMASDLAKDYNKQLEIVEIIPVGLQNRLEHIGKLKDAIYNHAANYRYKKQPVMGQLIPASYHTLDTQLQLLQQEVRDGRREPIMHHEEFRTMVQQMNLVDIQDDEELKTATLFLTDVGTLLHYDDRSHNLHELYFIDPQWLCKMMAKVVTVKERNPFPKSGILHIDDIPQLFKGDEFPLQYFQQYMTLLYRFEVVLPLDKKCVLITSMLPKHRPDNVDIEVNQEAQFYSRFIIFDSAETPPGFWSRLLSRIMHSISRVSEALEQNVLQKSIYDSMSLSKSSPTGAACMSLNTNPSNSYKKCSSSSRETPDHFTTMPVFPSQGEASASFNRNVHCNCWETGFFYSDQEVVFRIESLVASRKLPQKKDGVLMIASRNEMGMKILGQLVNLVVSLVREWYPGLMEGKTISLKQRVPCYECVKMGVPPFEFEFEECLLAIQQDKRSVMCQRVKDCPEINHTVSICDIVPDLLLKDIDAKFLLKNTEDMYTNQEEQRSASRKSGCDKLCKRKFRGTWVTIKYFTNSKEGYHKFQSEIKFLQKAHHPCLICLVGVSVRPKMTLVIEETPNGSLDKLLIEQQKPVHRITLFRIAAQVAAALKFLHSTGILFRDLRAANVLWWTINPESLCHCKLTNFGTATDLFPVGARGLQGAKGFTAPEVLYIGRRKEPSLYDHRADIFSFAMFLYQMMARKHPYHNMKPERIDRAIQAGERPELAERCSARSAYCYLIQLMKECWKNDPEDRPTTDTIMKYTCQASVQSIMSVHPTKGSATLKHACLVTPSQAAGDNTHNSSEVWVCSNGKDEIKVDVYSVNTMVKITSSSIRQSHFRCVHLCKDHVWVGARVGISHSTITFFSAVTRKKVHEIPHWEYMISCITCSSTRVYVGTLDGLCYSFPIDIKQMKASPMPPGRYISDSAIDGILFTAKAGNECVWVSHTRYIYFLNPHNLALEEPMHLRPGDDYIGQLSTFSGDSTTVWSAHVGNKTLSAWDIIHRANKFDIDVAQYMDDTIQPVADREKVITAMTPALDTVWVGMASGHILVFADQDLLTWYHPYNGYIRFITAIPCAGPCEKEECMVVTGAENFKCPIPESIAKWKHERPNTGDGVMILWEAFSAKILKQMKVIEDKAPNLFDNHKSLRDVILKEDIEFKDGTHLLIEDSFSVKLIGQKDVILDITCSKPAKLTTLLSKLQKEADIPEDSCKVEYRDSDSGECVEVKTQEDLNLYMKLKNRPQLLLSST